MRPGQRPSFGARMNRPVEQPLGGAPRLGRAGCLVAGRSAAARRRGGRLDGASGIVGWPDDRAHRRRSRDQAGHPAPRCRAARGYPRRAAERRCRPRFGFSPHLAFRRAPVGYRVDATDQRLDLNGELRRQIALACPVPAVVIQWQHSAPSANAPADLHSLPRSAAARRSFRSAMHSNRVRWR